MKTLRSESFQNLNLMIYIFDTFILNLQADSINLMRPRFKRSTEGRRAFAVRATKQWKKLSVDIKQSTNVKHFKRSLFKIILDDQILSKLFL